MRERIVPLPHAHPFALIDRLLAREPGSWAAALKNLSRDEAWVDERGAWPLTLLAEVMAQTAGLAAVEEGTDAVLVAIDRFRCLHPAAPMAGDGLLIMARVARRFGATVKVRGLVRVGSRRCAAAELTLRIGPTGSSRE